VLKVIEQSDYFCIVAPCIELKGFPRENMLGTIRIGDGEMKIEVLTSEEDSIGLVTLFPAEHEYEDISKLYHLINFIKEREGRLTAEVDIFPIFRELYFDLERKVTENNFKFSDSERQDLIDECDRWIVDSLAKHATFKGVITYDSKIRKVKAEIEVCFGITTTFFFYFEDSHQDLDWEDFDEALVAFA